MIEIEQNIDSIHIKLINQQNTQIIKSYILQNNLTEYYNKNTQNKYGKHIVKKDGIILFSYYNQTNKYNSIQSYIMLEIHGLKKYSFSDHLKKQSLMNLLLFLRNNTIQYDIQKLDFSIDIKNIKLNNLYIRKNTKRNLFNNIINHNQITPFILEATQKYNSNRNNRLISYDKSYKENIQDKSIQRIEISLFPNVFREIRKLDNPLLLLSEIKKEIQKYKIYVIGNIDKRNELVEEGYKTNERINKKIDKLLNLVEHQIVEYEYQDLEEILCYF